MQPNTAALPNDTRARATRSYKHGPPALLRLPVELHLQIISYFDPRKDASYLCYASPITTSTTRCLRSTKSCFCRLRPRNSSESDGFLLAVIVFAYGGPSCSRRTRDLRVDGKSPTEPHLGCGSVSHSPAVARHAMRWTTSIHSVLLPLFCSQCKMFQIFHYPSLHIHVKVVVVTNKGGLISNGSPIFHAARRHKGQ